MILALAMVLVPRENLQSLPANLVSAESSEGEQLLAEAGAVADHGPLISAFEAQDLVSFCGVASSVIVLNALGQDLTQWGFFTSQARQVRSFGRVALTGMTLADLGNLLRAHGARVTIHRPDSFDVVQFRDRVRRNLSSSGDYLLVNYQRSALGQTSSGHISPLAGYDEQSDRVLILDTASYRYPHTWVALPELYRAMATLDRESGELRGYVEINGLDRR